MAKRDQQHILVTGVTGYVGGRLVPRLLNAGYKVRVMARDMTRLQGRSWLSRVEIVEADVLKPDTLGAAMQQIDIAYYLIHSMSGEENGFHERDLNAARNFGAAAQIANVQRIVYLGGLGDSDAELSEHLRSRQQTGQVLRKSGIPVTEFRAAVIVGSGSKSFEMIRYLTERVPVMVCPRWVYSKIQPIAIRDVLSYLVQAAKQPESSGKIIEIGGRDVLTYADMMMQYAEIRKLKRVLVPVPVLTPRLSSYWVHWVTPIPASLARPLIEGVRNEVIVKDQTAKRLFPDIEPLDYRTAVRFALDRMDTDEVETSWSDAMLSSQGDIQPVILQNQEGMHIERRQQLVDAEPEQVYRTFTAIGGDRGWLSYEWAWRLRGIMDRMVGGVGFRRGRRDPNRLRVGDALDFWRVEAIEPGRLLRLRAEMKVPGRAWLEFQSIPRDNGTTLLTQTAYFAPKGLAGLLYWNILYPIHALIFSSLIRNLAKEAHRS